MKEMHQSRIHGIFLGRSPKTFGCFIRVICIALADFIPWSHHHIKSLSLPQMLGTSFGAVLHWLPPPWGMRKALEKETGGWKNKKKKTMKKPQLWLSWVARSFGNSSAAVWCACEQAEWSNKINYTRSEKIKWKAPPLEFVEEEMEISTFSQQRAWEELWEGKVLEIILYVKIGKIKGVVFSLN